MAKQDVLDAIDATIVENGQKGITAQALKNLLTMMVENGSGDGALRIMAPFLEIASEMFSWEFTPAVWTELVSEIELEMPGFRETDFAKAIEAAFAHNAQVYQQIIEKTRNAEGVLVLIDYSAVAFAVAKATNDSFIEGYSVSSLAECTAVVGDTDNVPTTVVCRTVADNNAYPAGTEFSVNADGGLLVYE